jgi:ABC transporter substrate binding protein
LKFIEVDLIGVYVAPIALLIIAAWFVTIALPDRGPLRLAGLRVASGGVRVRRVQASARSIGIYAGRVLNGVKLADLPVIETVKFQFVINLTTAKSLGAKIADNLLSLADEVIE